MDTFMDKLAQKLNAQEMIKANSAAEAEEMEQLKSRIREYDECLGQLQQVNKELKAVNHDMELLLTDTITPQIQKLVEESVAKIQEIQQDTEALDAWKQQLNEKLEASDETVHKECVKVYRNVQASMVEENEKLVAEIVSKVTGACKGKLNAILGVSIAALVAALGSVVFQLLTYFHIF